MNGNENGPIGPEHRWSGWPGAWCLDCGAEDARELCVASHPEAFGAPETEENPFGMQPHCENPPCPEPGSNRHNPYGRTRGPADGIPADHSSYSPEGDPMPDVVWNDRPIERIGDELLIVLDRFPTRLYAANARALHLRTPYAEASRLVGVMPSAEGRPEVVRPGEGALVSVTTEHGGVGFVLDVSWRGVRYSSPGSVYAVRQPDAARPSPSAGAPPEETP